MMKERKGGSTLPAILLWIRCNKCKKQTWHITSGKKDDPRVCMGCLQGEVGGP